VSSHHDIGGCQAGTDDWAGGRLQRLVTRGSMIGVARARDPREIGALA